MLRYTDRKSAIQMAREGGMSDKDILKYFLQGEFGVNNRKELIIDYGKAMGLEAIDALQLAHSAGLVPSTRRPPKKKERLHQKK